MSYSLGRGKGPIQTNSSPKKNEAGDRVKRLSQHHGDGRSSETTADQLEPLAPPHKIRQGNDATALLSYGRLPPAWINLRPYNKTTGAK